MKLLKSLFLAMLFIAISVNAQTTTTSATVGELQGGGKYIQWAPIALDSAETEWTQIFTVGKYDDHKTSDVPVHYGIIGTAADSINIAVTHWVCYFSPGTITNWIVADTLVTITAATLAKGTANMNAVKAPYHKLKMVNNTGSKANVVTVGEYWPVKGNN